MSISYSPAVAPVEAPAELTEHFAEQQLGRSTVVA